MTHASMNLLLTIVDRGKGDTVARMLSKEGVMIQHIALGTGTAHKGLLALLGLKDTAKDVVVSFLRGDAASGAMRRLNHALEMDLPGKGIAFTVPLGSVGGSKTMQYFLGAGGPDTTREESKAMQQDTNPASVPQETPAHDLIVTIVNRGFTDLVMDAALPAGARGGTVVHARGAGTEEASQFFGITIQPEKEMVLILVRHEQKVPVMQAITRGAGLNTEGHGLVFSVPVTDVMGVTRMTEEATEEEP
ncbi:MAG: P-II family nitrogen regulator [Clostridia bacterium]|nr:P-II family nitrogen regulator [Clostridia bacterium]